ncbi:MAG TPA: mechanosensitive ion channel domain-containing protein [Cellvibrionaceae bacterium]
MTFRCSLPLSVFIAAGLIIWQPKLAAEPSLLNPLDDSPAESTSALASAPAKTLKEQIADVKNELAAFNQTLAALPPNSTDKPSEDYVSEKRNRLDNVQRALEELLAFDQKRDDLKKRQDVFAQERDQKEDPEKGPPYTITYKDKLQRIYERTVANVSARELQIEFLQQQLQNQITDLKNAEASVRQQEENLESNSDPALTSTLQQQVELQRLRLKEIQSTLNLTQANISYNLSYLELEKNQREAAQKNLDTVKGKVVFKKEDLDRLTEKYTQNQKDYAKEGETVYKYAKQVRRDYDSKRQDLTAEKEKPRTPEDTAGEQKLAELNNQFNDLTRELERADRLVEMVQHSVDIAGVKRLLWEARYKAFQQKTPEVLASARETVNNANRWVSGRSDLLIAKVQHDYVDEQTLTRQLKGKVNYQVLRERIMDDAERVLWLAKQLDAEINSDLSDGSITTQLKNGRQTFFYQLKQLWNYEVFSVEDTVKIDGKAVTASRGVTVSKLSKVLLVVLLGALAVVLMARWGEHYVIKKWFWRKESARLARRWIHGLGFVVLTLSALSWANIPLSVFAFMGGALAIGFGFGVQNLLKNLMSGVMLLLERPLRIGDLIELDSVQGTVINIGIRSVTIRGGNGVETLVPNSLLIEQKLTNWTYSNNTVRFQFSIGVDYNSPVERVREILQDIITHHACILKDPYPEVSFDDFGADSLVFNVYYWLDLGGDLGPRKIASELRFSIFKAFTDAKINIAFPQRDIHLHTNDPLRVQVAPLAEDKTG